MAPSSVTAPTVTHGPTSLHLCKLSHCTTTTQRSNLLWTHLPNRDDMFAVFDQLRRKSHDGSIIEKKVLKLVRAGELLEQIELDTLRYQVHMDEQRAQSQVIGDDNLCVLVIVKKPLLALRYQLADGNIRKIQMNFQPASGCDVTLNTFKSIGLPIRDRHKEAQSQSQMRQPTSVQGAPQSSQPRSQETTRPFITAYEQVERPDSAAGPISSQHPPMQQIGTWNNASCDSIQSSAHPSQSHISRSTFVREGMTEEDFSKPISYIQDPITRNDRHQGSYDCRNNLSRPSSSSAVFETGSYAPAIPLRLLHNFDSQISAFDSYEGRPSSAPETQSARFLADSIPLSQMLPPRRELPFPIRVDQPLIQKSPVSKALTEQQTTSKPSRSKTTGSRAKSAKEAVSTAGEAVSTHTGHTSDDKAMELICPDCGRSDFKKPIGLLLHCNSQHDREFQGIHAAIEASIQGNTADKEEGAALKNRKVSKVAKQNEAPSSAAPMMRAKKAASKKRTLDTPPPSSAPPKLDTTRRQSSRVVSPIVDTPTTTPKPKENLSKRPKAIPQESRSNKQPGQESKINGDSIVNESQAQPDPTFSNITPAEYLDSLEGWIRKYHNLPAPEPAQTAKDQLAEYAKQSNEDRAKILDDMICDSLGDENFIKLVEDVEGAWRRIGLGV